MIDGDRSLEEEVGSVGPVANKIGEPVVDVDTGLLQLLRISVFGCVQLSAVTAIVAVTGLA